MVSIRSPERDDPVIEGHGPASQWNCEVLLALLEREPSQTAPDILRKILVTRKARHIMFDADGAYGVDGYRGHNGSRGSTGFNGQDGADAGKAVPGTPGGTNMVTLGSHLTHADLKPDVIQVEGFCQPHTASRESKTVQLAAQDLGRVVITAVGGLGGAGGHGGDGGNGGRGYAGQDATSYSYGTDGGPGGNGGDGGQGTHGTDGGRGGQTEILCHPHDTFLLMAIVDSEQPKGTVRGGDGGRRATHGVGGNGGPGGSGGSSYSWTETTYGTDANGNTTTDTEFHFNPGGSSGRRGYDGHSPSSPIYDGTDGAPGTFTISLLDDKGRVSTRFDRRFDLSLVHFSYCEEDTPDQDGIYEFGETVMVRNLCFRNVGGMPTPPAQRIRISLNAGDFILPTEDEAFIAASLQPGDEVVVEGPLRFKIRQPDIRDAADPLVVNEAIRPRADQLGPETQGTAARHTPFQRHFFNANTTETLTARFPLQNSDDIVALRSLASGERTRIAFGVENISCLDFGSESERQRRVAVQLSYLDGDVPAEAMVYLDQDGLAHPLEGAMEGHPGYYHPIRFLEAEGRIDVRGQVGFRAGTPDYAGVTLRYTIWMSNIEAPTEMRRVQHRDITLRAEPAFAYRMDSKVIMVTSNATTREAFLSWKDVLERSMGLQMDHWSISRYGHFDHQADLPDGTNLRVHLEDKVALVLNQPFNPRSSPDTDLPTEYLKGRDFREAVTSYNTHFALIGSEAFSTKELLEPTTDISLSGDPYPDSDTFLELVSKSGGPLTQETFRDDITLHIDRVALHKTTFPFTKPQPGAAMERAFKLQQQLMDMHPNRRYVIVVEDCEPEKMGHRFLFFPKWHVGTAAVRRTLNTETSSAVIVRASDKTALSETFIRSSEVRFSIALSLPFEDKLIQLNWLLQRDDFDDDANITANAFVDAILVDLTEEQVALRNGKGALSDAFITEKLANFGRLLRFPFETHLPVNSPKWERLFQLVAGMHTMARIQKSWWMLWGRNKKITRATLEKMEIFTSDLFGTHALDPEGDVAMDTARASERISAISEGLLSEIKRIHSGMTYSPSLRTIGANYFQIPPNMTERISRDIDSWLDPKSRVWTPEQLHLVQEAETTREAKQTVLKNVNRNVRAELLVVDKKVPVEATEPISERSPVEVEA
jgi:hypothetical protein